MKSAAITKDIYVGTNSKPVATLVSRSLGYEFD